MRFKPLDVDVAVLVRPVPRGDDRGWFARIFCAGEFEANGLEPAVSQVNLATTAEAGTVRGLHYQLPAGGRGQVGGVRRRCDLRRGRRQPALVTRLRTSASCAS